MVFNYLVERTRMFNSLGRTDGMSDAYENCIEILKVGGWK